MFKLYIKQCYLFCLKCKKTTGSKNATVVRTKNGKIMLLSKCAVCNSKKSKFLKEQEAKGLISSLKGTKMLVFSDLPILNAMF